MMDLDDLLQDALNRHRDGDLAGAGVIYAQILEHEPHHPAANLNLASIALAQDKLEAAVARLQGVLARDEDNGVAHLLYARALFRQGKHPEGLPHMRAAWEALPEDEGIAAEYVAAVRRHYFLFDAGEYQELFAAAQAGSLGADKRRRLAHLTLMRLLRPELVRLVVEPALPQDSPDAISRWLGQLPVKLQGELAILARNFVQACELCRDSEEDAGTARLAVRRLPGEQGPEEVEVDGLADADTLTGASLELVVDGELRFVPFSAVRSIEFADPAAAMGAVVTLRDGTMFSGLMPLFYLFTEFAESEKVRNGQSTLIRPLAGEICAGVGLRTLRAGEALLPIVRVERIEFDD
ncbi:MAG: tetratricopeptide repeat protein [Planctomycetes bacterium]|nr:tetratricopeptide repeat protein [Planctomycetota bacterium]